MDMVKVDASWASYFHHFGSFHAPEGLYEVKNDVLIYAGIDFSALAKQYSDLTEKRFPIDHWDELHRYGPQFQDLVRAYLEIEMPIMAKQVANWARYHDAPDDDMTACTMELTVRVDRATNVTSLSYAAGSHCLLERLKDWVKNGMMTDAHVLFHDVLNHGLWTEDDRLEADALVKECHTYTCFQSIPFPAYHSPIEK